MQQLASPITAYSSLENWELHLGRLAPAVSPVRFDFTQEDLDYLSIRVRYVSR